jgi:hypothetical protein
MENLTAGSSTVVIFFASAGEVIRRLEWGIVVLQNCPGMSKALEPRADMETIGTTNPSTVSLRPPERRVWAEVPCWEQQAMDLAELKMEFLIALEKILTLIWDLTTDYNSGIRSRGQPNMTSPFPTEPF